jgi:hypothetical protein
MGWRKSTIEMFSPAVTLSMSSCGVMRAIRSRRRKRRRWMNFHKT